MNRPTYQDYLADPSAVLEQVGRAARRERVEAVHQLIIVPLKQIFKRALSKPAQVFQSHFA
jgi:hypothetical protein